MLTLSSLSIFEIARRAPARRKSLVSASLLASRQDLAIADVCLVVWVAAVPGDFTGYLIGPFGGRPILSRYGWLVKLTARNAANNWRRFFRLRGDSLSLPRASSSFSGS